MTLYLTLPLKASVVAHCRACAPAEACGILAGYPTAPDRPTRHIRMSNTSPNRNRFTVAAEEQLRVFADLDRRNQDPLVIYHSHPRSEAVPSATDREAARDPKVHHLIVSLTGVAAVLRSWRLTDAGMVEEDVVVETHVRV